MAGAQPGWDTLRQRGLSVPRSPIVHPDAHLRTLDPARAAPRRAELHPYSPAVRERSRVSLDPQPCYGSDLERRGALGWRPVVC